MLLVSDFFICCRFLLQNVYFSLQKRGSDIAQEKDVKQKLELSDNLKKCADSLNEIRSPNNETAVDKKNTWI